MSAYDLVNEVKNAKGIPSDNALAVAIGKERATVSGWKRGLSKPDGESILKLCVLGNIEPKEALRILHGGYGIPTIYFWTCWWSICAWLAFMLYKSYPYIALRVGIFFKAVSTTI